ncbi:MAG TPA: ribosome maturation factor RimP [Erysipelotrichaceae bacterium]|nr:ribosome maturation factor RimP [Erysipelotrichia bacterium]HPX33393.1 ribosome maturation factor RimP [Erysipelotrichaceae bacterium]HQA85423.1 ribosome maturation factor RimP [Erysipelotrichaceae bacterium]
MLSIQKIESLIKPILEANNIGKFKVSRKLGKTPILEICIKKIDGEIDLDICEIVSNQISEILDQHDDSNQPYLLDVCSFGAEEVLENEDEIINHIGDYVHIELKNPEKGIDSIDGTLTSFEDNILNITYFIKGVKKQTNINYDNVKLIRLAVKI